MPRAKKSKPVPILPGDFETWFTNKKVKTVFTIPRGPVPPELQEGRYIEPENLDSTPGPRSSPGGKPKKKDRRLPPCPPYLDAIRAADLSAHDWRRLMLFFLRRLHRKEPELSKQFTWDLRSFERLRQAHRQVKPGDPHWIPPRLLLARLKLDAPLAKDLTADEELWLVWYQWYTLLVGTPRSKWGDLSKRFTCENGELKNHLDAELREAATNKKSTSIVARGLTAIQANPKEPKDESVRTQLSRAGLATWAMPRKRPRTRR